MADTLTEKLHNWLKSLKDRVQPQPKQEWSEDDEQILQDIIYNIRIEATKHLPSPLTNGKAAYQRDINWLESLKDRIIPQQKQEWSEADKRKINRIYSILQQAADTHAFSTSCRLIGDKECIELQDFLKSLRPQTTWKPNEEQMEAHDRKSCPGIKFRVGDMVVCHDEKDRYFGTKHRIAAVYPEHGVYVCEDLLIILIKDQESYGLWEPGPSADDDNINNN